uniref:Uncharacterized protein n=1 Tax=Siphoviridae sp. ctGkF2 TaxID=2827823 RepID=A0A8S5TMG4_9CAUD|nr:MAG TPA: hypothetical protein [Siphoviridae sp. ctGkF2]
MLLPGLLPGRVLCPSWKRSGFHPRRRPPRL